VLYEPLTEQLKMLIQQNVEEIINYDPRVRAQQVIVTQYESGLQIACTLIYLPYYIQESMQLTFDQNNGLTN
jgi:phage baseplate assembly protein W